MAGCHPSQMRRWHRPLCVTRYMVKLAERPLCTDIGFWQVSAKTLNPKKTNQKKNVFGKEMLIIRMINQLTYYFDMDVYSQTSKPFVSFFIIFGRGILGCWLGSVVGEGAEGAVAPFKKLISCRWCSHLSWSGESQKEKSLH